MGRRRKAGEDKGKKMNNQIKKITGKKKMNWVTSESTTNQTLPKKKSKKKTNDFLEISATTMMKESKSTRRKKKQKSFHWNKGDLQVSFCRRDTITLGGKKKQFGEDHFLSWDRSHDPRGPIAFLIWQEGS